MFSRKVNKLSKEDVVVIMNMFDSVETITYIGDDKYQIRLNKAEYSTTLIVVIKETVITNISLLNSYNAT
jgi:hypothetical protein